MKMVNKETKAFYEGTLKSELLIQQCQECGEYIFFPRKYCPYDMGELKTVKASGKGKILTYTVVFFDALPDFKDMVPYVAAIVELEEGLAINTRIETDNPKGLFIGQKVEVVFREQNGQSIPLFTIEESAS